jgi:arylformamidase
MSRIWDISQPLHAAVPVWPGEPAFALHSHAVIGDGCPVNVGGMFTPLHAGTHGDAPLHYANDGASSADCELDAYIGPCVLLDMRHARGPGRDCRCGLDRGRGCDTRTPAHL